MIVALWETLQRDVGPLLRVLDQMAPLLFSFVGARAAAEVHTRSCTLTRHVAHEQVETNIVDRHR